MGVGAGVADSAGVGTDAGGGCVRADRRGGPWMRIIGG